MWLSPPIARCAPTPKPAFSQAPCAVRFGSGIQRSGRYASIRGPGWLKPRRLTTRAGGTDRPSRGLGNWNSPGSKPAAPQPQLSREWRVKFRLSRTIGSNDAFPGHPHKSLDALPVNYGSPDMNADRRQSFKCLFLSEKAPFRPFRNRLRASQDCLNSSRN